MLVNMIGDLGFSGVFKSRLDNIPREIRYIRHTHRYSNGTAGWYKIRAYDYDNVDVALGKQVVPDSLAGHTLDEWQNITATNNTCFTLAATEVPATGFRVTVDLGIPFNLSYISIGQSYSGTSGDYVTDISILEVSLDGESWHRIFNSNTRYQPYTDAQRMRDFPLHPYVPVFDKCSAVDDILVGKDHIYVLVGNMNTVQVFKKRADGTFGDWVKYVNWYAKDTTIGDICVSGSSVPYAYCIFIEDDKEFIAGWGASGNIRIWEIDQETFLLKNASVYSSKVGAMASYSRGAWDGSSTLYFYHRTNKYFYSFDLRNKDAGCKKVSTAAANATFVTNVTSSFTGSGMLVRGKNAFAPSGSNESQSRTIGVDIESGQLLATTGSILNPLINLNTICAATLGFGEGLTNAGNIFYSPLHQSLAYCAYRTKNAHSPHSFEYLRLGTEYADAYYPKDITTDCATLLGSINSPDVQLGGFCWSTSNPEPTTKDSASTNVILEAPESLEFKLTGLTRNTTYYVRAWGRISSGMIMYSMPIAFTTLSGEARTTTTKAEVSGGKIVAQGQALLNGGIEAISHGFCWSRETATPTLSNNSVSLGKLQKSGSFSTTLMEDYEAFTTYYVRAFITTVYGTWYGDTMVAITSLRGAGTEDSPYLISNEREFNYFRQNSPTYINNKFFALTQDIYLTSPLARTTTSLSGFTLDGRGYRVHNVLMTTTARSGALFYTLTGAKIKNIGFLNVNLTSSGGSAYIALMASYVYNGCLFENIHIDLTKYVSTAAWSSIFATDIFASSTFRNISIFGTFSGTATNGSGVFSVYSINSVYENCLMSVRFTVLGSTTSGMFPIRATYVTGNTITNCFIDASKTCWSGTTPTYGSLRSVTNLESGNLDNFPNWNSSLNLFGTPIWSIVKGHYPSLWFMTSDLVTVNDLQVLPPYIFNEDTKNPTIFVDAIFPEEIVSCAIRVDNTQVGEVKYSTPFSCSFNKDFLKLGTNIVTLVFKSANNTWQIFGKVVLESRESMTVSREFTYRDSYSGKDITFVERAAISIPHFMFTTGSVETTEDTRVNATGRPVLEGIILDADADIIGMNTQIPVEMSQAQRDPLGKIFKIETSKIKSENFTNLALSDSTAPVMHTQTTRFYEQDAEGVVSQVSMSGQLVQARRLSTLNTLLSKNTKYTQGPWSISEDLVQFHWNLQNCSALLQSLRNYIVRYDFSYTGAVQTFVAPSTGIYVLEAWGAAGGRNTRSSTPAGRGGYAKGKLFLTAGAVLNIYVGGKGTDSTSRDDTAGYWPGGFNGGGAGCQGGAGGGGASDIRYGGTQLNKRVIVAGGAGGVGNETGYSSGGYGGGLVGGDGGGSYYTAGATQTSGNALGQGGNYASTNDCGGGGGGYYGGRGGRGMNSSGSGGSGFVTGLIDGLLIAGNTSMPAPAGGTETGHPGNGFIRITPEAQSLIFVDNKLYTYTEDWTPAGVISNLSPQLVFDYGFSLETLTPDALAFLNHKTFEVYSTFRVSKGLAKGVCEITFDSQERFMDAYPEGVLYSLSEDPNMFLLGTRVEDRIVRCLLSINKGATFLTYSQSTSTWEKVSKEDILSRGMSKDDIASLTLDQLATLGEFTNIDFLVAIKDSNVTDSLKVRSVSFSFAPNSPPYTLGAYFNLAEVHDETVIFTATLVDRERDPIYYQMLINGEQFDPPTSGSWGGPLSSGSSFRRTFNYNSLKTGDNVITLNLRDSRGAVGTYTGSLTVLNTPPSATSPGGVVGAASFTEFSVAATLFSEDNDPVRYRVTVNGEQVYPKTLDKVWSDYREPPTNIYAEWEESQVLFGKQNVATLEIQDPFGAVVKFEHAFIGTYKGLLFTDKDGEFYSDSASNILKYLDIGTLIAGQSSLHHPVWIENKNGYPVTNLRVTGDDTSLPEGVHLEISYNESPFEPEDTLVFTNLIPHGERTRFYVRIVTEDEAEGDGQFEIQTKADPLDVF